LTVAVLPAVWLINRDDDAGTRPNVAAVGLPAEDAATATPSPSDTGGAVDPMGDVDPRYLTDNSAPPPAPQQLPIAVGNTDHQVVATAVAIYRRSVGSVGTCLFNGVGAGETITVFNVDNGRSVECRTKLRSADAPAGELVMHPDRFIEIADLTSAPVHVEIRQ
jgi:hypothetical protein